MAIKIVMPRLSLTMTQGSVSRWYKREGETIEKGEPLVEVNTEKVIYDVEAPASGILYKILALEGKEVPVAEALGIIIAPGEEPPKEEIEASLKEEAESEIGERVLATPAAKRLAREHSIDLAKIKNVFGGRITEEDVEKFIEEMAPSPQIKEVIPLIGVKKIVAERMSSSFRTAPHSSITMEVNMYNVVRLHEESNFSYSSIFVMAVAKALKEHPIVNSTLDTDKIKVFNEVNIGLAVATERGLIVPVIKNADKMPLTEISSELEKLIDRTRVGDLKEEDLRGGTFTITNLGMFGVDVFTPIINPPEAAILGIGRITEKPIVINKEIMVKPMSYLSLSFDHRIIDGAPAAEFLSRIKNILETTTNNKTK